MKSPLIQTPAGTSSHFQHANLAKLELAIAISVAVLLRIFITIRYANLSNPELWEFGKIAKYLLKTGVYSYHTPGVASAYMPPAYPLLIAFFYQTFGISLGAHVALATLLLAFEVAIPFLVGWMASKIWDQKVGLVAFIFSLFWPAFLIMSGRLHSVPIYTALLILACGVLFSKRSSTYVKPCLVGSILGVYANLRYEAILFLFPFVYYIVRTDVTSQKPRHHKITAPSILLVSFFVVLTPWLMRNYRVFGKPILSTSGGLNLIRGHHAKATGTARDPWPAAKTKPDAGTILPTSEILEHLKYDSPQDELIANKWYFDEATSYIKKHPGREVELVFRKAFYFLVADLTHPVARLLPIWAPSLLALSIGFLFFLKRGISDPRQLLLWMLFTIQLALALVFFVVPRYRMIVDFIPLTFFCAWTTSVLLPRILCNKSLKSHDNPSSA